MNRRRVLQAGAALLGAPLWLRSAFAGETGGVAEVAAAFRRAQAAKRPLLVLIVPTDRGAGLRRGLAFGALLNHGTDDQIAPLGRVEVVAATQADLQSVVPAAGDVEALMVLVRTDAVPARVKRDAEPVPRLKNPRSPTYYARMNVWLAERIAVLVGGRPAVGNQAKALAEEVRGRLVRGRIPGSYWASSMGCGVTIEDPPPERPYSGPMMACGIGHVPPMGGRFLSFYVGRSG